MQRLATTSAHVVMPSASVAAGEGERLLFTGCYTDATPFLFGTAGAGILAFSVGEDGALTPLSGGEAVPAGTNPTYIVANKAGTRLYCANESEPSAVAAFAIDRSPGATLLTPLSTASAEGLGACWVTLSPDETHLLATNYTSGSAVSFPITDDGIGAAVSVAPQEGLKDLGPNSNRQDGPHAHALMFSPISPTDCYIPDLGLDMVWHYKFDSATGGLTLSEETSMPADGVAMGPRHIAVHPSGEYAYIVSSLGQCHTYRPRLSAIIFIG
jgi:6-phosphogluconolactonase